MNKDFKRGTIILIIIIIIIIIIIKVCSYLRYRNKLYFNMLKLDNSRNQLSDISMIELLDKDKKHIKIDDYSISLEYNIEINGVKPSNIDNGITIGGNADKYVFIKFNKPILEKEKIHINIKCKSKNNEKIKCELIDNTKSVKTFDFTLNPNSETSNIMSITK